MQQQVLKIDNDYGDPKGLSFEFIDKVSSLGSDKEGLLSLMQEIDSERRLIKSRMSQFSNSPKDKGGWRGSNRYVKLAKMKDKCVFLFEEREYIRRRLGQLKGDKKSLNRMVNSKTPQFCHAFMAAAERMLEPTLFNQIEAIASRMLNEKSGEEYD